MSSMGMEPGALEMRLRRGLCVISQYWFVMNGGLGFVGADVVTANLG